MKQERYCVVEIHGYSEPTDETKIGEEQLVRWGHTFGEAATWDEADELIQRITSENQGAEPLMLAIYDSETKVLSVP